MEIIKDGELYHYGRKGMKWGQHIYGKKNTGTKGRKQKDQDDEFETVNGRRVQTARSLAKSHEDGSFIGPKTSKDVPDKVKQEVVKKKKLDDAYKKAMEEDDPETARKKEVIEKAKLDDEYERYSPEGVAKNQSIENMKTVKSTIDGATQAANAGRGLANTIGKIAGSDKKAMEKLSSMSDAELRTRINRIQMEQQYASLHPSKVSRGAHHVGTALEVIGGITAMAAAGMTIAVGIKTLKG